MWALLTPPQARTAEQKLLVEKEKARRRAQASTRANPEANREKSRKRREDDPEESKRSVRASLAKAAARVDRGDYSMPHRKEEGESGTSNPTLDESCPALA